MPINQERIEGTPSGVAFKQPCRVATTANITLSGLQTIDGVALADGDRVLVKSQTTQSENGIYVVHSTAWARATDFDGNRDVVRGTQVRVHGGSAASGWYEVTASDPIVIGTTSITFQRWVLSAG